MSLLERTNLRNQSQSQDLNKNMKKFLLPLLLLIVIFSCKNLNKQLQCFDEYQKEIRKTEVYIEVLSAFKDTLKQWVAMKLQYITPTQGEEWQIDSTIFFNTTMDRCLLLLLRREKSINSSYLDNAEIILAVKKSDGWHFYFSSMPSIGTPVREDPNNPGTYIHYTFEQMSRYVTKRLIKSGYYKRWSCTINDEYVNGWYDGWEKKWEEVHQHFLRSGEKNQEEYDE